MGYIGKSALLLCFSIGLLYISITPVKSNPIYTGWPDLSRRVPQKLDPPGCTYKGQKYVHGEQVETPEPCLNCTCARAVLVCYLRVCPTAVAPPPGCFPAREPGKCCPTIICGINNPVPQGGGASNSEGDEKELRPTFKPTSSGITESHSTSTETQFTPELSETTRQAESDQTDFRDYSSSLDSVAPLVKSTQIYTVASSLDDEATPTISFDGLPQSEDTTIDQLLESITSSKDFERGSVLGSTVLWSSEQPTQDETIEDTQYSQLDDSQKSSQHFSTDEKYHPRYSASAETSYSEAANVDMQNGYSKTQPLDTTAEIIYETIADLPSSDSTKPKDGIVSTTGDSILFVTSTDRVPSAEAMDYDMSSLNDIPGGCFVNGTLYGDGSAMISASFCEYCFCIRGKQTCMKPKCHIAIEGCEAQYDNEYSCCPSRYDCSQRIAGGMTEDSSSELSATLIPITITEVTAAEEKMPEAAIDRYCKVGNIIYSTGSVVPHYQTCHNCYCNGTEIVCKRIECSPAMAGCKPIIPKGHCCPLSYRCDTPLDGFDAGMANNIPPPKPGFEFALNITETPVNEIRKQPIKGGVMTESKIHQPQIPPSKPGFEFTLNTTRKPVNEIPKQPIKGGVMTESKIHQTQIPPSKPGFEFTLNTTGKPANEIRKQPIKGGVMTESKLHQPQITPPKSGFEFTLNTTGKPANEIRKQPIKGGVMTESKLHQSQITPPKPGFEFTLNTTGKPVNEIRKQPIKGGAMTVSKIHQPQRIKGHVTKGHGIKSSSENMQKASPVYTFKLSPSQEQKLKTWENVIHAQRRSEDEIPELLTTNGSYHISITNSPPNNEGPEHGIAVHVGSTYTTMAPNENSTYSDDSDIVRSSMQNQSKGLYEHIKKNHERLHFEDTTYHQFNLPERIAARKSGTRENQTILSMQNENQTEAFDHLTSSSSLIPTTYHGFTSTRGPEIHTLSVEELLKHVLKENFFDNLNETENLQTSDKSFSDEGQKHDLIEDLDEDITTVSAPTEIESREAFTTPLENYSTHKPSDFEYKTTTIPIVKYYEIKDQRKQEWVPKTKHHETMESHATNSHKSTLPIETTTSPETLLSASTEGMHMQVKAEMEHKKSSAVAHEQNISSILTVTHNEPHDDKAVLLSKDNKDENGSYPYPSTFPDKQLTKEDNNIHEVTDHSVMLLNTDKDIIFRPTVAVSSLRGEPTTLLPSGSHTQKNAENTDSLWTLVSSSIDPLTIKSVNKEVFKEWNCSDEENGKQHMNDEGINYDTSSSTADAGANVKDHGTTSVSQNSFDKSMLNSESVSDEIESSLDLFDFLDDNEKDYDSHKENEGEIHRQKSTSAASLHLSSFADNAHTTTDLPSSDDHHFQFNDNDYYYVSEHGLSDQELPAEFRKDVSSYSETNSARTPAHEHDTNTNKPTNSPGLEIVNHQVLEKTVTTHDSPINTSHVQEQKPSEVSAETVNSTSNIVTVHIGAPLSVSDSKFHDRTHPNEHGKSLTTESDGVIFMNPEYADIRLDKPTVPGNVRSSVPPDTTELPLERFEEGSLQDSLTDSVESDTANQSKKKGPRIQDTNLRRTGAVGDENKGSFQVIPFVVADAVRGQLGIGRNRTILIHQDTSTPGVVSDFCFLNGRLYTNGEVVRKADPCELCRCFYGKELCQLQRCPTPPSPDCVPEYLPGFCCPRLTCGKNQAQEIPSDMVSIPIQRPPIRQPVVNTVPGNVQGPDRQRPGTHFNPPIIGIQYRPPDRIHTQHPDPQKLGNEVRPGIQLDLPLPQRQIPHPVKNIMIHATTEPPIKFGLRMKPLPAVNGATQLPKQTTTVPTTTEFRTRVTRSTTTTRGTSPITAATFWSTTPGTWPPTKSVTTTRVFATTPKASSRTVLSDLISKSTTSLPTTQYEASQAGLMDPWGLLKVSGCNIYGKFYNVNEEVEILSDSCKKCICAVNGVECSNIC